MIIVLSCVIIFDTIVHLLNLIHFLGTLEQNVERGREVATLFWEWNANGKGNNDLITPISIP